MSHGILIAKRNTAHDATIEVGQVGPGDFTVTVTTAAGRRIYCPGSDDFRTLAAAKAEMIRRADVMESRATRAVMPLVYAA